MRRSDILLAVLIIGVLVALAIATPRLLDAWRATEDTPAEQVADMTETEEQTEESPEPLDPQTAAELERVNTMLMLHHACVNRFDGFDAESRETVDRWKQRHGDLLARSPQAEPDFHIVLAEPEGGGEVEVSDQADERGLCDRNLEAMRSELENESETGSDAEGA